MQEQIIHITAHKADGGEIRVNLPVSLVRVSAANGVDISQYFKTSYVLKKVNLNKIMEKVEAGKKGRISEFTTKAGDLVEVDVQ